MNIYEFAMKMEKDGEAFYRETARTCGNKGVATILTMMADDEVKHYNAFKLMRDNNDPVLADSLILDDAKNVFEELSENSGSLDLDVSQVDLYRQAQDVEKRSEEFFLEKAGEVESEIHRKMFTKIAKSEREHYKLLGHIIDFVNQPNEWLENAEWHHMEEY